KRGEAEAIGGIMPAPGRDKYYDFVRVIMSIEEYVYFKESMFGATKTFTFSELSLYEVGIVDEDAAVLLYRSKIPNPNKQPKLYGSYEDLVKGAVAGEVSIFLMEQPVARYWLDKYDKNRSYIRSPTFLFTEQQYVAVRKGDSQLARLIRDGFSRISTREMVAMRDKWEGYRIDIDENFFETISYYARTYWLVIAVILYFIVLAVFWLFLYIICPRTILAINQR